MSVARSSQPARIEFVALMAMMFAVVAFGIDAMLPAMSQIATDLDLSNPQYASFVITAFIIGLGAGTIICGPLSDAIGRKPVAYGGLCIYAMGASLAWLAPSLEWMIAARLIQGLGASGPRIVSAAIIRDLYSGRQMAQILSFTMTFFLIVPAVAPLLGACIIDLFGWRAVFLAFVVFALLIFAWFGARIPETLPVENRRALRAGTLVQGVSEVLGHPVTRLSIIVQTLLMTLLYSILTMVQPIFEITYARADSFPYWFGAVALIAASATILNSRLVMLFGMRRLATLALAIQIAVSALALAALPLFPAQGFVIFMLWLLSVFFQAGMTTANLNAIAMEPMGHIAGTAATVMAAISTIVGAIFASQIALMFDGTPVPLILAALVIVILSSIFMQRMRNSGPETSA